MLQKLEDLSADNNQLAEVPETLNDLPRLTNLNLRQNQLKALPELSALVGLKTLAVSSNELTDAPLGLEHLAALEGLYLNGNK
jgi:internalin A